MLSWGRVWVSQGCVPSIDFVVVRCAHSGPAQVMQDGSASRFSCHMFPSSTQCPPDCVPLSPPVELSPPPLWRTLTLSYPPVPSSCHRLDRRDLSLLPAATASRGLGTELQTWLTGYCWQGSQVILGRTRACGFKKSWYVLERVPSPPDSNLCALFSWPCPSFVHSFVCSSFTHPPTHPSLNKIQKPSSLYQEGPMLFSQPTWSVFLWSISRAHQPHSSLSVLMVTSRSRKKPRFSRKLIVDL